MTLTDLLAERRAMLDEANDLVATVTARTAQIRGVLDEFHTLHGRVITVQAKLVAEVEDLTARDAVETAREFYAAESPERRS